MSRQTDTYVLDRGGTVLAGRYRVIELLGVGARGSVWIAEHLALRRKVVVKFHERGFVGAAAETALHRFLRETRSLASVRHRNVIELHEVGRTNDGEPYLIRELLQGETLAQRLGRERTLALKDAVSIATAIADGLEAVHACGIVHRDVKPENVFLHVVDGHTIPKLLDFGLARNIESSGRITWSGAAIGTPGYMAPEQARGEEDLDHRVDVYALGVVLYEMLAGELPFGADSASDLVLAVTKDDPIPLTVWRPDLAGPLGDAVMRALAPRRSERHRDVRAMRAALRAATQAMGDTHEQRTAPRRSTGARARADTPPARE